MKTKNILLVALAVLTVSSCKDSEEEEPMNPVTEQILATGLNVGADGVDTTVVFPKSDAYGLTSTSLPVAVNGCRRKNVRMLLREHRVSAFSVHHPILLSLPERLR